MTRYVRRHISQCFKCVASKPFSGKQQGLLHPIPPPDRPFERLHLDHVGPFPKSSGGHTHILVVIDALTRYVRLFPVMSTSTDATIKSLELLFLERGLPLTIVTDCGTAFTSKKFHSFISARNVRHVLNAVRHPRANGIVERVNRTVVPMIIMESEADLRKWHRVISSV